MSAPSVLAGMSATKLALLARSAREQAGAALQAEPIAIIGIGCRFPGGADSAEAVWALLAEGRDAVGTIPAERWRDANAFADSDIVPGKTVVREGGCLEDIAGFDAAFFGILSREADKMDPQQRLALEVAIEALDDAGLPRHRLSGSATGVFLASYYNDYQLLQLVDRDQIDARTLTGTVHSVLANRVSYLLDLRGPSLSVDTACSSSLVAIHLACQSLRAGESEVALAGGVSLMVTPEPTIALSKMGVLSPTGRCRTLDASADGFIRGEGCGVIVLKRLGDAIADGDRVIAVIRGSAVNQDGHSTVLSAPNGLAQEALLREALAHAQLGAERVGYVEMHGTGTPLGDPVEAEALGNVYGVPRASGMPCYLGSVKANIGHLEAAAGVAGVIKAALVVQRGEIPRQVHFRSLNPHISLEGTCLAVADAHRSWEPPAGMTRLAGVSGFGVGGTNAHVLVEQPPATLAPEAHDATAPLLLPLSAQAPEALDALTTRWIDFLADDRVDAAAACATAAARRSHYTHRLAVAAPDVGVLRARLLAAVGRGEEGTAPGHRGRRPLNRAPRIAFVCSGQGPQWAGMLRDLRREEPVVRTTLAALDALFTPIAGWSLQAALDEPPTTSRVMETEVAQPLIFALQMALADLWASWGVRPDAIVGHSIGEVAALCIAGVLTREQAVHLVHHRGRLMQRATGTGAMLAVGLDAAEADALAREIAGPVANEDEATIAVAAINGPRSVVLAGTDESIADAEARLTARGVFARLLPVAYAFHSPQMTPFASQLVDALGALGTTPARLAVYSTVTGTRLADGAVTAEYFARNMRGAVRFAPAMDALLADGVDAVVELAPHPVLATAMMECAAARGIDVPVLASLRRDRDERFTMREACAALYAVGVNPAFEVIAPCEHEPLPLPAYPWQHAHHWFTPSAAGPRTGAASIGSVLHPLLGRRVRLSGDTTVFEAVLDADAPNFLMDHQVHGAVVVPGTTYVELAFAAARFAGRSIRLALADLVLEEPLVLGQGPVLLQTVLTPEADGLRVAFFSAPLDAEADDAPWCRHAAGVLVPAATEPVLPAATDMATDPDALMPSQFYTDVAARGLTYGAAFRGIVALRRGNGAASGTIATPPTIADDAAYAWHPAIVDACLQVVAAAVPWETSTTYLPMAFERIETFAPLHGTLTSHCVVRAPIPGSETIVADLRVDDAEGRACLDIRGVTLRPMRVSAGRATPAAAWLYDTDWEALPPVATDAAPPGSMAALLAPAAAEARRLTSTPDGRRLPELDAELERVAGAYAVQALRTLGWDPTVGATIEAEALGARLAVLPRQARLFARLLDILAEDGVLVAEATGWRVVRALPTLDAAAMARELLARHPDAAGDVRLLERCGGAMADALRGDVDGLELLFPGGSLADTEQVYAHSPLTRAANALVATTVRTVLPSLLQARPIGTPLRVLEIGGGTGGTTRSVLPLLPADRTTYTFTDLSPVFGTRARDTFAAYPFLTTAVLDIGRDPAGQGFQPQSVDLIVAANVLHATSDVRTTLEYVRGLLAPGGVLVMLEGLQPHRFADLTVGVTEGWWSFDEPDGLRRYALMPGPKWMALFADLGLEGQILIGDATRDRTGVLVARAPGAVAVPRERRWLVVRDRSGVADELIARLRLDGDHCTVLGSDDDTLPAGVARIVVDLGDAAAVRAAIAALGAAPSDGVLLCQGLDVPGSSTMLAGAAPRDAEGVHLDAFLASAVPNALHVVQGLLGAGYTPPTWFVTRGARAAGGAVAAPAAAALLGLARAIPVEHPELRCLRVDLDPAVGAASAAADVLLALLRQPPLEDDIALRGDQRLAPRLQRRPVINALMGQPDGAPLDLVKEDGPPSLDALQVRQLERRVPEPNEVEVQVAATGLGFRDVLNALGEYPGPPIPLGGEFAGEVVRVGASVVGISPGDRVFGMAVGAFRSFVTVHADNLARVPDDVTLPEAAALPSSFVTAWYALRELAALGARERVLVHAGAGGVGMAAIQIAQAVGAEVHATAGTEAKRDVLRAMGVRHVYDSRRATFTDALQSATGGAGVDVVLNSLADEFIPASLEVLAHKGRFIELGKRGVWTPERMRTERPDVRYELVDLGRDVLAGNGTAGRVLREVVAGFATGALRPLPVRAFRLDQASAAFRFMAQARHVGKIVITQPPTTRIRADGSYLITGGTGGVGLRMAQWLATEGAGAIVLLARRAPSDAALATIATLEARGTTVRVVQADVGRAEDVDGVLTMIDDTLPPLRGVFHGVLSLRDSSLVRQTRESLQAMFAARVRGAWLLHERTKTRALDLFVLSSAAGTLLGAPGQANYSASNTWLDALAHYRQACGLPALTVQWGLWGEIGAATDAAVVERLAARGVSPMPPEEAVRGLAIVLSQAMTQPEVAIMRLDWPSYFAVPGAATPFLERLRSERSAPVARTEVRGPSGKSGGATSSPSKTAKAVVSVVRQELDAAPSARRLPILTSHVRAQVLRVLGVGDGFALDTRQPLLEVGLDSLMAVELRTLLGATLGLTRSLPATLAFDHPSVEAISRYLHGELFGAASATSTTASSTAAATHAAPISNAAMDVSQLSDAEAEALLLAELDDLRKPM